MSFDPTGWTITRLPDRYYDFAAQECSERMRDYAETICAPRLTDATEVPLTPFALLLAEAIR